MDDSCQLILEIVSFFKEGLKVMLMAVAGDLQGIRRSSPGMVFTRKPYGYVAFAEARTASSEFAER